MKKIDFALSLLFTFLLINPGFSQIGNGGFEAPAAFPPNWGVLGGPAVGGPGAGGSANSAQLGPSVGFAPGPPGWSGTKIEQKFLCAAIDSTRKCYVKFDYRLVLPGGGAMVRAGIRILGPAGPRDYFFLAQAAFVTRQVEYPVCDSLLLQAIIIQNGGAGITATFRIDNFMDRCDTTPFPGIPIIPPDTSCQQTSIECDVFNLLSATPTSQNTVPTLSQWGIVILGLLILCFGAVYLVRRKWRIEGETKP